MVTQRFKRKLHELSEMLVRHSSLALGSPLLIELEFLENDGWYCSPQYEANSSNLRFLVCSTGDLKAMSNTIRSAECLLLITVHGLKFLGMLYKAVCLQVP